LRPPIQACERANAWREGALRGDGGEFDPAVGGDASAVARRLRGRAVKPHLNERPPLGSIPGASSVTEGEPRCASWGSRSWSGPSPPPALRRRGRPRPLAPPPCR